MTARWSCTAVVIAACGGAEPPHAPPVPSNRAVAPHLNGQAVSTIVVGEYPSCTTTHHIEITVDTVITSTIELRCPGLGEPVGLARGPRFEIAPGAHVIGARDRETGQHAEIRATFPASVMSYSMDSDPVPSHQVPSDAILVDAFPNRLNVDLTVESNVLYH